MSVAKEALGLGKGDFSKKILIGLIIYPLKLPDRVQIESTSPELSEAAAQRIEEVAYSQYFARTRTHPPHTHTLVCPRHPSPVRPDV